MAENNHHYNNHYRPSSTLGSKIGKTGEILRKSAISQINDYQSRFFAVSKFFDLLFCDLMVDNFDFSKAADTAKRFFGKSTINFVAVDGTDYSRQLFDMVIFYAGAYTAEGTVSITIPPQDNNQSKESHNNKNNSSTYDNSQKFEVKYNDKFIGKQEGGEISSCVPVYINRIPEIDQTLSDKLGQKNTSSTTGDTGDEGEEIASKPVTDEAIINNSAIADFLMTFSEFYMAYKLAANGKHDIIFLDRSLSNMYSSLIYDTSNRTHWSKFCTMLDLPLSEVEQSQGDDDNGGDYYYYEEDYVDVNDLTIARHYIVNNLLDLPPPRGDYLRYAIFHLLQNNSNLHSMDPAKSGLSFEQICSGLGIEEKTQKERVQSFLAKYVLEGVVLEHSEQTKTPQQQYHGNNNDGSDRGIKDTVYYKEQKPSETQYEIAPRYKNTWNRITRLVEAFGKKIFRSDEPFVITRKKEQSDNSSENDNKTDHSFTKEWLTTMDLSFLTLFSFYLLIEECWQKNILLLGITKDTAASEFKNHVIPICINNGIWKPRLDQQDLDLVPNTDRMMLQAISMYNHTRVSPPWALVEYDSAFVMTIPDFKKRKGFVSGAIQNKIIPTGLFVRSFVQLEQAEFDGMLRSNVLSIDRLVYPEFDLQKPNLAEFYHEYAGTEKVQLILHKNKQSKNELQNMIVAILKSMSSPSIPEAFGHNKPLYVADKVAKWHNEQFHRMVESTGSMILNNKNLRNFVFYMSTFRERRGEFESKRKKEQ